MQNKTSYTKEEFFEVLEEIFQDNGGDAQIEDDGRIWVTSPHGIFSNTYDFEEFADYADLKAAVSRFFEVELLTDMEDLAEDDDYFEDDVERDYLDQDIDDMSSIDIDSYFD